MYQYYAWNHIILAIFSIINFSLCAEGQELVAYVYVYVCDLFSTHLCIITQNKSRRLTRKRERKFTKESITHTITKKPKTFLKYYLKSKLITYRFNFYNVNYKKKQPKKFTNKLKEKNFYFYNYVFFTYCYAICFNKCVIIK